MQRNIANQNLIEIRSAMDLFIQGDNWFIFSKETLWDNKDFVLFLSPPSSISYKGIRKVVYDIDLL